MTVLLSKPVPAVCAAALLMLLCPASHAQRFLKPSSPDAPLVLPPGDEAVLESTELRDDLPCVVRQVKPELGFDLRFHTGYVVNIRMQGFSQGEDVLTTIFRVRSASGDSGSVYLVDHVRVPAAVEEREGDASLRGAFDLGQGDYHVDWMMRDRAQRVCSSHWDVSARLSQKQSPPSLQIAAGQVMPSMITADSLGQPTWSRASDQQTGRRVSVIANLGSRGYGERGAMPAEVRAVVSALQTIGREPRIGGVSLTVVDIVGQRVVYRNGSGQVDWTAIGESLKSVDSLTVNAKQLREKNGEAEFLASVAAQELGAHPDALIFISPKLTSELRMPREVLERFAGEACPVFYMSIDADPAKDPFRDLIANATRYLRGVVYTIRQPEDLLHAWNDMTGRFLK